MFYKEIFQLKVKHLFFSEKGLKQTQKPRPNTIWEKSPSKAKNIKVLFGTIQ